MTCLPLVAVFFRAALLSDVQTFGVSLVDTAEQGNEAETNTVQCAQTYLKQYLRTCTYLNRVAR